MAIRDAPICDSRHSAPLLGRITQAEVAPIAKSCSQSAKSNSAAQAIDYYQPLDESKEFVPPKPTVPWGQATQGHYDEWIRACKTGSPTACNFQYAGLLIEHNMLGNVA